MFKNNANYIKVDTPAGFEYLFSSQLRSGSGNCSGTLVNFDEEHLSFNPIIKGTKLTHFLTASHCSYDDYLKKSTKT